MKLLFLRGKVPTDIDPREIMYDSLDNDFDMWEHLACALGDERTEIAYIGGNRHVKYNEKCNVRWYKNIDLVKPDFTPDVVFCRGGFDEWYSLIKRFPSAKAIYYGAGKRIVPKGGRWDIVLADTDRQRTQLLQKDLNAVLWSKPAAPFFEHIDVPKEYDVCFVGDGRFPFRNKIKRVDWVYKTAPADLKILHLGWRGSVKPPENITVRRVLRRDMPIEYSRCSVLAVPYDNYDSAPRVIPEALACGLSMVAMDSVNFNNEDESVMVTNKENFWVRVRQMIGLRPKKHITFNEAVEYLRKAINGKG